MRFGSARWPVAAVAALVLAAAPAQARAGALRLPDLDQETPSQLDVMVTGSPGRPHFRLGFGSAVRNVGVGPLIVDGYRANRRTPRMTGDQLIERDRGRPLRRRAAGWLSYVRATTHQHWHLHGFDRYELRRAGSTSVLVRDRKSGFCLGDRYKVVARLVPAAAPQPVYTGNCASRQPQRLRVREGISAGYGDNYAAHLEYQDLPLDGLRDGGYVLLHRVNGDRAIRESSYANNAASLLLDLRWRDGKPFIRILRKCPNTARCDRPAPQVRTVADGLEIPWDIGFLPDGRSLLSERPGRVRLLERDGRLAPVPVARVAVSSQGEGGLLGLAIDPQFRRNRAVYLYFTTAAGMRLERWRWTGERLVREVTLVDAIAAGPVHDSGRIGFGPDGRLYVATGDAGRPALAQDSTSLNGKLLALTPAQYRGARGVWPAVVATGLRNPQGFDWQPGTGALIANDHGPSGFDGPEGFDEVNLIRAGGNYGWPNAIGSATGAGAYRAPLRVYEQAIAPSGGAFVTQPGSAWTGDYVLAALRGQELRRLELRGGRIVGEHPLLRLRYGRLRTVREDPRGRLYVLTSNRDGRGTPRPGDDRILCVLPPRG
jgi:glucose/arabinose dehydrogenase